MVTIKYVIKDELGMHARPAGQLVKEATKYKSDIKISLGDKTVDAKRVIGVMGLAAKQGDEIVITIDGDDEEAAARDIENFLTANF